MKKVKSVAFNVADPMEYGMFHYAAKQEYFSTYMKRLIQRDMEDGKRVMREMDNDTYNAYQGKSEEQIKLEKAKESLMFMHESGLMDDSEFYNNMFQIQSELEKAAH